MVVGLPGTGKTAFAHALQEFLPQHTIYIGTDHIRRNIFQSSAIRAESVGYGQGVYSATSRDLIYRMLYYVGELLLSLNHVLIVDGTFYTEHKRNRFFQICEQLNQDLILIETRCSEETVKARLEKRVQQEAATSDADFQIYLKIKKQFEPPIGDHLVANTEQDPHKILQEVKTRLAAL